MSTSSAAAPTDREPARRAAARDREPPSRRGRRAFTRRTSASGWADRAGPCPPPAGSRAAAPPTRPRGASPRCFPGKRLIIPAGRLEAALQRHRLPVPRALGVRPPDRLGRRTRSPARVLVLEPTGRRPRRRRCYFRERAGPRLRRVLREPRDRRVLDRPAPVARAGRGDLGLATAASPTSRRARRGRRRHRRARGRRCDHRRGRRATLGARRRRDAEDRADDRLARDLSELRLVKDDYEIAEMRAAVEATARGFDDVIADLPAHHRAPARRAPRRGRLQHAAPAPTATRSATTRSPRAGRTPASCTGPATTAPSCRAT